MFESLTERFESTFKKLRGSGKLKEDNIEEATKELRLSLLEADVNYKVVKSFIEEVKLRALGKEVMGSITPAQQFIKIFHEELVRLMGSENEDIILKPGEFGSVMLVGLHGSGKTTTAAKLSKYLSRRNISPLLVPLDLKRPAAKEQLMILGKKVGVPVFDQEKKNVTKLCRKAVDYARELRLDTLLFDTAGRLHVDKPLMEELFRVKEALDPQEILLVLDAMTGQDAVNVALAFDELELTGIILTKLEGDTRGGAALSIKAVVGRPIKFVGVGESLDALERFHPERMASRIMGMGDVLTLVEKAEAVFDRQRAVELEKKFRENTFDLEDFRDHLKQVSRMGSLGNLVKMIPGISKMLKGQADIPLAEAEMKKFLAIIDSMTPEERMRPHVINGSRRRRISKGSGTRPVDINRLIKQYNQMKKLMQQMNKRGVKELAGLMGL